MQCNYIIITEENYVKQRGRELWKGLLAPARCFLEAPYLKKNYTFSSPPAYFEWP
jgi:hypothetical protein